jgi:hypothetical protein
MKLKKGGETMEIGKMEMTDGETSGSVFQLFKLSAFHFFSRAGGYQ